MVAIREGEISEHARRLNIPGTSKTKKTEARKQKKREMRKQKKRENSR
jgi:hypothetical protein